MSQLACSEKRCGAGAGMAKVMPKPQWPWKSMVAISGEDENSVFIMASFSDIDPCPYAICFF